MDAQKSLLLIFWYFMPFGRKINPWVLSPPNPHCNAAFCLNTKASFLFKVKSKGQKRGMKAFLFKVKTLGKEFPRPLLFF